MADVSDAISREGKIHRKLHDEFASPCAAAGGAAIFSIADEEELDGGLFDGGPFGILGGIFPFYTTVGCVPLCDVDVELLQEECTAAMDPSDCDDGYAVALSTTMTYCCPLAMAFE